MAKTEGFTRFICDRCGTTEFLAHNNIKDTNWHDVAHFTSEGITVNRLLCNKCFADYKVKASVHDADFNDFMGAFRKDK